MNEIEIDPHVSRIEYGNGCVRVDVGHGLDMNHSIVRYLFTPLQSAGVTKVEIYKYWTCESEYQDSEKIEEDYLHRDYIQHGVEQKFEYCLNQYKQLYQNGKIQDIEQENKESEEKRKQERKFFRKKFREEIEKAEKYDKINDFIVKNQEFDNQIPSKISENRWEEQDNSEILEEIYKILDIEITSDVSKKEPLTEEEREEKMNELEEQLGGNQ